MLCQIVLSCVEFYMLEGRMDLIWWTTLVLAFTILVYAQVVLYGSCVFALSGPSFVSIALAKRHPTNTKAYQISMPEILSNRHSCISLLDPIWVDFESNNEAKLKDT